MVRMTSRERVRRAIARREPDRVPIQDAPWPATIERWRTEGLPSGVDYTDYLDYDIRTINADLSPRYPTRKIAEDDEYVTETTSWGQTIRNRKDMASTPHILECPIKKKDDWPALKARLAMDADRVDWDEASARYKRWRTEGRYIFFCDGAGYDRAQSLINSEELLVYMAEEPEFIADIVMTIARNVSAVLEMMWERGFEFDALHVWNDMGYRNASLFSPEMYRNLIQPADRIMYDTAHRLGMQTSLHSCGRVSELIPDLLDAGIDSLNPLEIKAGMNPIEIKRTYGDRLSIWGGIDTRLLERPDLAPLEEEIKRVFAACMPGGGYLYSTDHSVPPDVSFEQYCRVLEWVKEYGRYS